MRGMIQKMGLGLLLCGAVIGARAEGFPAAKQFWIVEDQFPVKGDLSLDHVAEDGSWVAGTLKSDALFSKEIKGRFVVISQQGVKLYGDKDYDTEYLFVGDGVGPVVNAYLSNRAWVSFSVDKEGVAYRVPYVAADYTCALALPKGDTWCTNGRQQVVPKAPAFPLGERYAPKKFGDHYFLTLLQGRKLWDAGQSTFFIWSQADGWQPQSLQALYGIGAGLPAFFDASQDGAVLVGTADNYRRPLYGHWSNIPIVWTPSVGVKVLNGLGAEPEGSVSGVSADGRMMIGSAHELKTSMFTRRLQSTDDSVPVIWNDSDTAIKFADYLQQHGVEMPQGEELEASPFLMSKSGEVFMGGLKSGKHFVVKVPRAGQAGRVAHE
ncbi:hypothetical protein [Chromobacterium sp.]|uniref:hypothetical protein n=1 Tax=Chromobacterium sp. TaxID=306190 RepID=UPI0035AE96A5